jgi:hypothetical protein
MYHERRDYNVVVTRLALTTLLLSLSLLGCKDDKKPESSGFTVHPDVSDHVKCGFGRNTGEQWDEVTINGDGSIKWVHANNSTGTQEGFEREATVTPKEAGAWMQEVVDQGLFDLKGEAKGGGPRTELDVDIDGRKLRTNLDGLPADDLRAKLDELTAKTLRAGK